MLSGISLNGTWGLIKSTGLVVRAVMVILLLASVATWTACLVTVSNLVQGRRALLQDLGVLREVHSSADINAMASEPGRLMIEAVRAETRRSADLRGAAAAEGLKERVAARLISVESMTGRRMARTMNLIASTGATAPFVGLFGTVWGIMESFVGITKMQSTDLAVIAPGIADALLTTAMGLATAVPAVLIYNALARAITGYRALLADLSNAAVCVLSLDSERRTRPHIEPVALSRKTSDGL